MPPKIAHFDFGEEPSNFGDSASVQCLVTSGDLPVEFRWFFNGRPVSEVAGITTAKMGKRNSVLTIDSVTDRHMGNFSCQAANIATTVNFTAELIVNGTRIIQKSAYSFRNCCRLVYILIVVHFSILIPNPLQFNILIQEISDDHLSVKFCMLV